MTKHWVICIKDKVLHFKCSDGREGSEPWGTKAFHRIYNLIEGDSWEFIK